MGYIFNFNDALNYERLFQDPDNRLAFDLQNKLMFDMLNPVRGESVLDIGCGTGVSLRPFLEKGLYGTGLDPSPYMLDIAKKHLGNRVDFHRGFAEDLPFEDNAFHYALLVVTLEFVQDPQKALEEACRVAKDGVFLWVLNKFAIKGIQRRVKGLFADSIYNQARFFSIWELKQIVRDILGNVPVVWRTVGQLPIAHGRTARQLERFERSGLVQRCPFGEYTGMLVTPAPRYIAKPLSQLVTARNIAPES